MIILDFIKKHKLYKYVKENNSLLIFFLTVLGTAVTFVFRGLSYLYYYARYTTLRVPIGLISDKVSSVSITVTVIEIILVTISVLMGMYFVSSFKELKKEKGTVKKYKYNVMWLLNFLVTIIILFLVNYAFIILQGLEIEMRTLASAALLITFLELLMIKMTDRSIFGGEKSTNWSIVLFLTIVLICSVVVSIYFAGSNSATSTNSSRQIIIEESKEYVVVETLDDKYIVAECEEKDNKLTIHTKKQKVISYDDVEYESKKFESIELE